jgi:hypothetical protein
MIGDLDRFRRCAVPGCNWRVELRGGYSADRCYQHGGPGFAQYETSSDGIDILRVRFAPREMDPDFDPDNAA